MKKMISFAFIYFLATPVLAERSPGSLLNHATLVYGMSDLVARAAYVSFLKDGRQAELLAPEKCHQFQKANGKFCVLAGSPRLFEAAYALSEEDAEKMIQVYYNADILQVQRLGPDRCIRPVRITGNNCVVAY